MQSFEIYAKLVEYRNQAGEMLFARLNLANQLLSDKGWVEAIDGGGGDLGRALTKLEKQCFADICGALSLSAMLNVLHEIPDENEWKVQKYNLRKMYLKMQGINRKPKTEGPTKTETIRILKEENARLLNKIEKLEKENQELRTKLRKKELIPC